MAEELNVDEQGNVTLTAEQYQAMLSNQKRAAAIEAGFDMDNPVSELVLDQHWTPETSKDQLAALVEKYNVGSKPPEPETDETVDPPPAPKVEEVSPNGQGSGTLSGVLANGSSVLDTPIAMNPADLARAEYERLTAEGASVEDARVAALDSLLTNSGKIAAVNRIRARQRDEAEASALYAAQQAAAGQGSV